MKSGYFLLPVVLIFLVVWSCKKGNTGTHPQLSLESITTKVYGNDSLHPSDSMIALFKFQNNGGTLGTGSFYSIRIRLNQKLPNGSTAGIDTLESYIPDFGGANQGEFRYVLNGNSSSLTYGGPDNDTLIFKFFAMTPDSISTDTVTSPHIIVINN